MKNGKTKRHLLFAWVLASVPVFIPQYLSLNFVFCEYLFEGWERELVKFRLPSVFGKGEFSDSSRFWGEGEILTPSWSVWPGPALASASRRLGSLRRGRSALKEGICPRVKAGRGFT